MHVASGIASRYQCLKQLDNYLWGFGILQIVDTVSFGGDCSCSSAVEHSIAKKLRVRGVHVHAVWVYWGTPRYGDAKNNNIT